MNSETQKRMLLLISVLVASFIVSNQENLECLSYRGVEPITQEPIVRIVHSSFELVTVTDNRNKIALQCS